MSAIAAVPHAGESHVFFNQHSQCIDYLANLFIELESKASKAFDNAFRLDIPAEDLKQTLISIADTRGYINADGSKNLRGSQYELILTFAPSFHIDHQATARFRYALIWEKNLKGLISEIFEGSMRYELRPEGKDILSSVKLSDRAMQLYKKCRVESRIPILKVRAVAE